MCITYPVGRLMPHAHAPCVLAWHMGWMDQRRQHAQRRWAGGRWECCWRCSQARPRAPGDGRATARGHHVTEAPGGCVAHGRREQPLARTARATHASAHAAADKPDWCRAVPHGCVRASAACGARRALPPRSTCLPPCPMRQARAPSPAHTAPTRAPPAGLPAELPALSRIASIAASSHPRVSHPRILASWPPPPPVRRPIERRHVRLVRARHRGCGAPARRSGHPAPACVLAVQSPYKTASSFSSGPLAPPSASLHFHWCCPPLT